MKNASKSVDSTVSLVFFIGLAGTLFGLLISAIFNEIGRLKAKMYEIQRKADEAKEKSDRVCDLSSDISGLKIKFSGHEILKSDMAAHKADLRKIAMAVERLEKAQDYELDRPFKS
jgi:hypothetical protein